MRRLLLTMAAALPAFCGQAYTSARSGNWWDPAAWTCTPGPCAIPGNGDTASIQNGHKVTVNQSVTVGASGANNTTPAVALNCSGQIEVSGGVTLRVRGDTTHSAGPSCTSDAVILDGGAGWVFDSSQASAPADTRYRFGGAADGQYRHFACNGSAGARVTVTSDMANGALPGVFWVNTVGGSGWYYGGGLKAAFTDFSNIGDANTPGFQIGMGGTAPPQWSVQDSTFTACGRIRSIAAVPGAGIFIHQRNQHKNSLDATVLLLVNFASTLTTGARQITGNVFDRCVFGDVATAQYAVLGVTIEDNYFGDSLAPGLNTTTPWASFKRNFVRLTAVRGSFAAWLAGSAEDNYFYADGISDNVHYTGIQATLPNTLRGNLFGQFDNPVSDSGEVFGLTGNPASPVTQTLQNNILLPTRTGHSAAELLSIVGGHDNAAVVMEHNVWVGGTASINRPFGMLQSDEGGGMSNRVSMRSNIAWNTQSFAQPFFKIYPGYPASALVTDICDPANCDYNAGWNTGATAPTCNGCTNQGNGYAAKFTATPGQHDLSADPRWADYRRNVELFDTKYLGNTAPAWTAGQRYNPGDMATALSAEVYWGLPVNFRCTTAHDATEAMKPGTGANWRTYWEPASLYRLRQGILEHRQFTDGAIGATGESITAALVKWVRRGYTPANPAYYRAGHDGMEPGAAPMDRPKVFAPVIY